MKKFLCIMLSLIIIAGCAGCKTPDTEYRTQVTFYYCAEDRDYAPDSSVILSEERTVNAPHNDYKNIMQFYLDGPKGRDLRSPFPKDLTVTELLIDGETTYITLSTNLSYLTGIDLTLACMCIANTCFALTHTQNVDISAEHAMLDNAPSVFINYGSVLTADIY